MKSLKTPLTDEVDPMFKPSRYAVATLLTVALLLAACGGSTTQVIETVSRNDQSKR